jgi:predicted nucleic-acid-binding protein
MKGLDTNVLVRFLVKNDHKQARAVYLLFKQAETDREVFWVPLTVILETIWVLESVYQISRQEIVDSIADLLRLPVLKFESQPALQAFIHAAGDSRINLSDLLIACSARYSGCESVLTFDQRAARHALFERLQGTL